ncbi:helix-turn-helix domain-containing protein [Duganella violaceipulchra]|uniref:DNA-binding XRE family transcriptional regulator n=1 Tax=Duganella violaceipulchra TaxID=2849652 RepID=A0AA41H5G5_9BURK|nr:helix-turn-helix domain-containing protein [Duganella violaceicalia]MBV6320520.1 helix-turn-helix domain-containing protein [Duganella violaceicalia]MCP2008772.1 DNA-binding XRE family transcriptional regulator [Duganella violaceicalia]
MVRIKKAEDKESARARRTELYDAVARGQLSLRDAVKQMRKISRLTQAEFAAHRGVSTKVIKEIEGGHGNPTVQTLNRIGEFFGLEVAFVRTETLKRGMQQAAPTWIAASDDVHQLTKTIENIRALLPPEPPKTT